MVSEEAACKINVLVYLLTGRYARRNKADIILNLLGGVKVHMQPDYRYVGGNMLLLIYIIVDFALNIYSTDLLSVSQMDGLHRCSTDKMASINFTVTHVP